MSFHQNSETLTGTNITLTLTQLILVMFSSSPLQFNFPVINFYTHQEGFTPSDKVSITLPPKTQDFTQKCISERHLKETIVTFSFEKYLT